MPLSQPVKSPHTFSCNQHPECQRRFAVFRINQVFKVTKEKKTFCHSFINCGFKDQSADASSCMPEKSPGIQGMSSISASCIFFKLWLVYNIITIQKHNLEIQRAPKDLNHYLLFSQCIVIMVFYLFVDRVSSSKWPIKLHRTHFYSVLLIFKHKVGS